jgi:hypothetical protein
MRTYPKGAEKECKIKYPIGLIPNLAKPSIQG